MRKKSTEVKDLASLRNFLRYVSSLGKNYRAPVIYEFLVFTDEAEAFTNCKETLDEYDIDYDPDDEIGAFKKKCAKPRPYLFC